jgi:hypothetical protein
VPFLFCVSLGCSSLFREQYRALYPPHQQVYFYGLCERGKSHLLSGTTPSSAGLRSKMQRSRTPVTITRRQWNSLPRKGVMLQCTITDSWTACLASTVRNRPRSDLGTPLCLLFASLPSCSLPIRFIELYICFRPMCVHKDALHPALHIRDVQHHVLYIVTPHRS